MVNLMNKLQKLKLYSVSHFYVFLIRTVSLELSVALRRKADIYKTNVKDIMLEAIFKGVYTIFFVKL